MSCLIKYSLMNHYDYDLDRCFGGQQKKTFSGKYHRAQLINSNIVQNEGFILLMCYSLYNLFISWKNA